MYALLCYPVSLQTKQTTGPRFQYQQCPSLFTTIQVDMYENSAWNPKLRYMFNCIAYASWKQISTKVIY